MSSRNEARALRRCARAIRSSGARCARSRFSQSRSRDRARSARSASISRSGSTRERGFIGAHFAPAGGRMYFTQENADRIDAIRRRLHEWWTSGLIQDDAYYVLLAALIEGADRVANTAGVYAAYIKRWQAKCEARADAQARDAAARCARIDGASRRRDAVAASGGRGRAHLHRSARTTRGSTRATIMYPKSSRAGGSIRYRCCAGKPDSSLARAAERLVLGAKGRRRACRAAGGHGRASRACELQFRGAVKRARP